MAKSTRAPARAAKKPAAAKKKKAARVKRDGRCLSRRIEFTPRLTEHIRQRYEEAGDGPDVLARSVGVAKATIQRLVREQGWTRAAPGPRDLSRAAQLAAEARALAGSVGATARVGVETSAARTPTRLASLGDLPLAGGGEEEGTGGGENAGAPPGQDAARPVQEAVPIDMDDAIERLLRLVSAEIGVYEAMRARLKAEPEGQREALKTAHNLASLTSTLDTLRRMRAGQMANASHDDDDPLPTDIDALRDALARRIEAFMAGRPDDGDAGGDEPGGTDGA